MQLMLDRLHTLLIKTSRTFALNIPLLPSPLVEAVTLGYLLFRNADTIEDAYLWPKERRIEELERFISVINQPEQTELAHAFAAAYKDEKLIQDPNHTELLRQTPFLMDQHRMQICGTRKPGHKSRILHRVPTPIAPPAQHIISPAGAQDQP